MGISERHLRLLLEKGQVEGKKLGHDWIVLRLNYTRKRKSTGNLNKSKGLIEECGKS